jgi:hypothetical protein
MANPLVRKGLQIAGKAIKKRLKSAANKPKTYTPGKEGLAKKVGKSIGSLVAYEGAFAAGEKAYNKVKSINSTDNMSNNGPIDKSIRKVKGR